jgi:hypothetical protein
MIKSTIFAVLALAIGSALAATSAQAYSDRVNNACKGDYYSFCSAHPVGSTGLRRCMEANGRSISTRCVNALADAGEISRKYKR